MLWYADDENDLNSWTRISLSLNISRYNAISMMRIAQMEVESRFRMLSLRHA